MVYYGIYSLRIITWLVSFKIILKEIILKMSHEDIEDKGIEIRKQDVLI